MAMRGYQGSTFDVQAQLARLDISHDPYESVGHSHPNKDFKIPTSMQTISNTREMPRKHSQVAPALNSQHEAKMKPNPPNRSSEARILSNLVPLSRVTESKYPSPITNCDTHYHSVTKSSTVSQLPGNPAANYLPPSSHKVEPSQPILDTNTSTIKRMASQKSSIVRLPLTPESTF